MDRWRTPWPLAGVLAGWAGIVTSYAAAMVLTVREAPVVAIADQVIRLTPGPVVPLANRVLGSSNKTVLVVLVLLVTTVLFAVLGRASRERFWLALSGFAALALLTGGVLLADDAEVVDLVPVAVGFATWVVALSLATEPLRRADLDRHDGTSTPHGVERSRRQFLTRAVVIGGLAVVGGLAGRVVGAGRRGVEESRRALRLTGVSPPDVPSGVTLSREITPWQTPVPDFYRIDTAIVVPAIEPATWSLRIHGLVERELVLTYGDLRTRSMTDAWITLNCVSNPVGGTLVGNAWWSGVLVRDLLEEAGVLPGADAVLQTSEDGWNCGTPLAALTDERDAMLAIAMNGEPLTLEHGFPVRMVVPGLYGYVSATKWLVDLEVTRFADFTAYWTERGWAPEGPVKIASRIDTPRSGATVDAGEVIVGGVAWHQHTGIDAVEVAVDGGRWQPAELGAVPSVDTWVQWRAVVEVGPGDHLVRVRAIGADGAVQTDVVRDVLPDGATGLHTVDFEARG